MKQMAAADLPSNESHATANISLLARLQKLSPATLTTITLCHKNLVSFSYVQGRGVLQPLVARMSITTTKYRKMIFTEKCDQPNFFWSFFHM